MTDAVIFVDFLFHLLETFNSLVKLLTLLEKCPYSEFFWSVFSLIWTEHGEKRRKTPNTDTFHAVLISPYSLGVIVLSVKT